MYEKHNEDKKYNKKKIVIYILGLIWYLLHLCNTYENQLIFWGTAEGGIGSFYYY